MKWQVNEIKSVNSQLRNQLQELWVETPFSSPFISPSFLSLMTHRAASRKEKIFIINGFAEGGKMAGMWPLRIDSSGNLQFLPSIHSDQCTCLYNPKITHEELGAGLAHAIREIHPLGIFLQNIPPWGETLASAISGIEQAGFRNKAFAAAQCPVLSVEPGPGVEERLRKELNRHKRVKGYANKLKSQPGYCFEVINGADGLEEWSDEFCDTHEWLWDRTNTPSKYRSAEARNYFVGMLKAWSDDNLLIRFSIRLDSVRIAFVIGLASKGRLIFHHVARSPAFEKFRTGHVMVLSMGLWMIENRFNVLDFGIGGEDYKLRYANKDEALWRIYGSRNPLSYTFVRGLIEARIRKSNKLQRLWDELGNNLIRGKILNALRTIQARISSLEKVHLFKENGMDILKTKFITQCEIYYFSHGSSEPKDSSVIELKMFDVLEMLKETNGLMISERASLIEYRHNGARPFGIIKDGKILHVSWLRKATIEDIPVCMRDNAGQIWFIQRSVTNEIVRSEDCCAQVLQAILTYVSMDDIVIIWTDTWNKTSQISIEKAGFQAFGVRITNRLLSRVTFKRFA